MTTPVYGFQTQLKKGQESEKRLDAYFRLHGYEITPANDRETQRKGIDAHFLHRKSLREFDVEYKTDTKTQTTGNIFVETESVHPYKDANETNIVYGWSYTTQADFIVYCAEKKGIIILSVPELKKCLPAILSVYPLRQSRNHSYYSAGVCVPYDKMRLSTITVREIEWDDFERET